MNLHPSYKTQASERIRDIYNQKYDWADGAAASYDGGLDSIACLKLKLESIIQYLDEQHTQSNPAGEK